MIAARAVGFRHAANGPWLFADLSFSLDRGQTLVLLGRNGRGKTTLLKCVAGLLRPTAGEIRCDGIAGYVPQNFAPAFSYSVFDVVLMGRARHVGIFSSPTAADRESAYEALTELDLPYTLVSTGKGSPRRADLAALAGKTTAPYLVDPNTGVAMGESADICEYLFREYSEPAVEL